MRLRKYKLSFCMVFDWLVFYDRVHSFEQVSRHILQSSWWEESRKRVESEVAARVSRTGQAASAGRLVEESACERGWQRGEHRGWRDSRSYADLAYLELADASQSIYLAEAPLDR